MLRSIPSGKPVIEADAEELEYKRRYFFCSGRCRASFEQQAERIHVNELAKLGTLFTDRRRAGASRSRRSGAGADHAAGAVDGRTSRSLSCSRRAPSHASNASVNAASTEPAHAASRSPIPNPIASMPRPSVSLVRVPRPDGAGARRRPGARTPAPGTLPRTAPAARGPPRRARSRPPEPAVDPAARHEIVLGEVRRRGGLERHPKRFHPGALDRHARRADVRRSARGAPSRRRARRRGGTLDRSDRLLPAPSSSAISTAGRWNRSTMRDATIPTPACHPSRASTSPRAPA